jgi:hypothetical protein
VVNSLLALLVFPARKEKKFLAALPHVAFPNTSDCPAVEAFVKQHLPLPSLKVTMFNNCEDLPGFFRRLSNAISHKHLLFSGADPDSKVLSEITVTLQGKPMNANANFNWEISMTAADLEALSRYVAGVVINLGL